MPAPEITATHILALLAAGGNALLVLTSTGTVEVVDRFPASGMVIQEWWELLDNLAEDQNPHLGGHTDWAAEYALDLSLRLAEDWLEGGYEDDGQDS